MLSPLQPNRIAGKLIKALILFSSLITILTTAAQLWLEYDRDISAINSRFKQVELSYLNSIAENTWQADVSDLKLSLHGITEFPDFKMATVREENGRIVASAGQETGKGIIRKVYPLRYNYRGNTLQIGSLEVIANLEQVYDRIRLRVWVILASNGIKTFLVAIFMFALVYWLITRHLTVIADFAKNLDFTTPEKSLDLNRKNLTGKHDEIDDLADTLKQMQQKLFQSYLRLDESEHQKKAILQTVPDLIWLKDVHGKYLACNPMFERFFGVKEHEIIGKSENIFVGDEVSRSFSKYDTAAIENDKPQVNEQWVTFAEDGHQALLEIKTTPFKRDDGEVTGVLGIARDISKRKQAEEKIKASLLEKDVLLREIHHRVKNNLQVISSMLRLQAKAETDDSAIAALKESRRRVTVMARVHESLYLSKNLSSINAKEYLNALVQDTASNLDFKSRNISFKLEVDDIDLDIDHAVPCGQIVSELLSNSYKHAFPNEQSGNIEVLLSRRGGGEIELLVSDDGAGLPKEFDPKNTQTLGLKLVHALATQLSGSIDFNSSSGTRIQFIFQENHS